jgi:hypothetical protein
MTINSLIQLQPLLYLILTIWQERKILFQN